MSESDVRLTWVVIACATAAIGVTMRVVRLQAEIRRLRELIRMMISVEKSDKEKK